MCYSKILVVHSLQGGGVLLPYKYCKCTKKNKSGLQYFFPGEWSWPKACWPMSSLLPYRSLSIGLGIIFEVTPYTKLPPGSTYARVTAVQPLLEMAVLPTASSQQQWETHHKRKNDTNRLLLPSRSQPFLSPLVGTTLCSHRSTRLRCRQTGPWCRRTSRLRRTNPWPLSARTLRNRATDIARCFGRDSSEPRLHGTQGFEDTNLPPRCLAALFQKVAEPR